MAAQSTGTSIVPAGSTLELTHDDLYLLGMGKWYKSYEKMGAHPAKIDGQNGWLFRVWAPEVKSVHIVGDFNEWDPQATPMTETETGGVWEGFVPDLPEGALYKYVIETEAGELLYKADPYGFWAQVPPETASRTFSLDGYAWKDGTWMRSRSRGDHMKKPLNIYEVHLGSWKRHPSGEEGEMDANGGDYYTYDELSDELVAYVKDMNYTHVELLPIAEHPFDGSWGYQVTGYYAPTSRYGNPKQFMHFVESCHKAGIGVILDWVPGGFCKDAHGLATFNGHMLYEKEEHPDWGTLKFDLDRGQVRSFLISNALYWFDMYHIDGIRVDGVTSILYLNFGIDDPSQKKFNSKGTEEDFTAIDFVRETNKTVGEYHPDVMMIAEESTAWPLVTYPPEEGGLGFHYKWDMGWMHDTLHYMQTDFPWRPGNHRLLTFSLMYAFNENFVLALSHDEVVHGKCSLIRRMPGDWWRQFAGMRALAFYQMTHPGAKHNFMGNELATFIEWRYYEELQWFLVDKYETHRDFHGYVRELNNFYRQSKALWQKGYAPEGFRWIDADDSEQSIISFVRHGDRPVDDLVVLINFDPATYQEFKVGVPREGDYQEVFNTDSTAFGGSGVVNESIVSSHPEPEKWNGCDQSITIKVPPLAGVAFKRVGKSSYVPPKPPRKRATAKGTAATKTTKTKAAKKTTAKAAAAKGAAEKKASASSKAAPAKTASKPAAKKATPAKGTRSKKAAGTEE